MKTIYKYNIMPYSVKGTINLTMPENAEILSIQVQRGEPHLWAIVETTDAMTLRKILVRTTGNALDGNEGRYIGTFQIGDLVFHVFEEKNNEQHENKKLD